jgi:hypothetical protein
MNAQTLFRGNGVKAGEFAETLGGAAGAAAKAIEATAAPLAEMIEGTAEALAKNVEARAVPLADAVGTPRSRHLRRAWRNEQCPWPRL